jgi:eukaryotic-like serine/threonine-protein kinase
VKRGPDEKGGPPSPSPEVASAETIDAADLSVPAASAPETVTDGERYKLGDVFARGGIGRIRIAQDRRLGRTIAVKELLTAAPSARLRFTREAALTARLQHPAIVPIYDAGEWPGGDPFYAMKLVRGRSLEECITGARSLGERLALLSHLIAVAEAVAYAHSEGIIHRDLKPANVLVGAFGETVVIDWGLAKEVTAAEPTGEGATDSAPGATVAGAIVGTPSYMPPEQAGGRPVDRRADVYALGAMLYHTLGGAPPFEGSATDALHRVLAGPPPPLASLEPGVPRDLATIVDKAMARDPAKRYESARGLVEDLVRFQTGQLVGAHVYSRWTLARRWIRRHRAAALALLAVAAVGGFSLARVIGSSRDAHAAQLRAEAAARTSDVAREEAQRRERDLVLVQARASLADDPTASIAWLKRYLALGGADTGAVRAIGARARAQGVARHVLPPSGRVSVYGEPVTTDGERVALVRGDQVVSFDVSTGAITPEGPGPAQSLVLAPGGGRLLAIGTDGAIRLLERGSERQLTGPAEGVWGVHFSPDGKSVVLGRGDGAVMLVETATGTARTLGRHASMVPEAIFTPDGTRVLTMDEGALARLWSLDGKILLERQGIPLVQYVGFVFSPDGQRVASPGDARGWLLDLATGDAVTLEGHTENVASLVFSPDGATLVSASHDRTLRTWDPATGAARAILKGHAATVTAASYAPDGDLLVSGSEDRTIRLWSRDKPAGILRGHGATVRVAQVSRDGKHIISASDDGAVRVWDRPAVAQALDGARPRRRVTFGPKGELASTTVGGDLFLLDAMGTERTLTGHTAEVRTVDWTEDGKRLFSSSATGEVFLWDVAAGTWQGFARLGRDVGCLVLSPDEKRLLTCDFNGAVRLWDIAAGTNVVLSGTRTAIVASGRMFSTDGRWVAVPSTEGTVYLWDLVAGGPAKELRGHAGPSRWVGFLDERRLVSSGEDGTVRLWDVEKGETRRIQTSQPATVSRDGRFVAAAHEGAIAVWRLDADTPPLTIRAHEGEVTHLRFTPDGNRLISVGQDRDVTLSDPVSGKLLRVIARLDEPTAALDLDAKGERLAITTRDGVGRIFTLTAASELPVSDEALASWLEAQTAAVIGADNRLGP